MGGISDFLFARPSFIEGLARLIDFGGTLNVYNESDNPAAADALALEMDWRALEADCGAALEQWRAEHEAEFAEAMREYEREHLAEYVG